MSAVADGIIRHGAMNRTVKRLDNTIEEFIRKVVAGLLAPHPEEIRKGTRFQEEARSERLVNVIRFCLVLAWTSTSLWGKDNEPLHMLFNFTAGMGAMAIAYGIHVWLSHRSYTPIVKYVTTTLDMCVAIGLMIAYAVAEGPVFMFKMPIFVNLLCALGLAAFRFSPNLVLYGTALVVGSLACLWWWLHAFIGIEYGSRLQHAFAGKLNAFYLTDILLYTAMFGFVTAVLVLNLRRQMELRVVEAARAAREEERFLMASGLAHEVRNPLAGISGRAQLIREAGKADEGHVTAILEDTRRLNVVVDEFLHYARPFPVNPRPLDLVGFLEDFCRHESLLQREPLMLETTYRELVISTDGEALNQILLNLVQNARRFQPEGLPIHIRLEGNPGEALIRVEDDGPGVDPCLLPRLFLPFQASGHGGTGLGLALTRKIVRELGGDVMHESRMPTGACFTVIVRPLSRNGVHEQGS